MIEEIEICQYCGFEVELLEIVYTPVGNRAVIRFQDGRQDEVPLGTLEFIVQDHRPLPESAVTTPK